VAGGLGDGDDGGVAELGLDGDGVIPFADGVGAADDGDAELAADFVFDDGGDGEDAEIGAAEGGEGCAVVEFTDDQWANFAGGEPGVEGAAHGGGIGGEEHGGSVERVRESAAGFGGGGGGGAEGDAALAEEVAASLDFDGRADGGIAEDDVESAGGEFEEKAVGLVLAADEADGLREAEGGFEEEAYDGLGDDIDDADGHAQGEFLLVLHGIEHFLAEGEDVAGVVVDDAAGVGEGEAPAGAVEEFLAEERFELFELMVGWETRSSSAARTMLPSRATTQK
jgi:hypothetical protein